MAISKRTTGRLVAVLCLSGVAASAYVSQYLWRESGLRALQARNEPRIEIIASALRSEINRQDHLPIFLSLDADVRAALQDVQNKDRLASLSEKLQRISTEADAGALYVVARNGAVVAAGQFDAAAASMIGRNLSDRSYVLKAFESGRSSYLGLDPASNLVRYYLAEAIATPAPIGAAVVRIEFDALEATWARAEEHVLVTDADGIVFLASDPVYKYRKIAGANLVHLPNESAPPSYPEASGTPLDLTVIEPRGVNAIVNLKIGDRDDPYFHIARPLPEYGWTIHRFTDLATVAADQRDGAIIGAAVSGAIILLLLGVLQRQQAYRNAKDASARLQSEVAARTRELRDANALLQTEVDERRRTETRLRTTQNELVQAGKLAALGQMSAAIAHEVNQPLAAIRTFLASTKVFAQRGDNGQVTRNLDVVDGLAERMASIMTHLKFFARKSEPGRPEPVEIARAVDGALLLTESQIKAAGVMVRRDVPADVWVMGYAVQLEQVLVNLIRNALDALAETKSPVIEIFLDVASDTVRISIADNGPGIPASVIDSIFDPFVTTKPVGKGLGLGLSISYGIVQDFHGRIWAAERAEGGAELIIELPRLIPQAAMLEQPAHA